MVTGHYPTSIEEALSFLEIYPGALLINGGTDVMVVKKEAEHVIFLNQVESLKKVEMVEAKPIEVNAIKHSEQLENVELKEAGSILRIGAGATYDALLKHPLIPEILKQAISQIASPSIRNVGTIGGNICNASPAGDTLPVLYALDAVIVIARQENDEMIIRKVPIEEFIKGIRKIDLKANEMVIAIEIMRSAYKPINHMVYEKVGARKSEAISKASFVGLAQVEEGILKQIKVAFGAVSITAVRKKVLEASLVGKKVEEIKAEKEAILSQYAEFITPIDDQRSTAEYRKAVCLNLLGAFLEAL